MYRRNDEPGGRDGVSAVPTIKVISLGSEDVAARALCQLMERALVAQGMSSELASELSRRACHPVATKASQTVRKKVVSKYNKELGKQLRKLKKKHPKTAINKLMKRAHAATKRALK